MFAGGKGKLSRLLVLIVRQHDVDGVKVALCERCCQRRIRLCAGLLGHGRRPLGADVDGRGHVDALRMGLDSAPVGCGDPAAAHEGHVELFGFCHEYS